MGNSATGEAQRFTVESFATGERRTVTARHWWDALADQPGPCFTVVREPGGQHAAISLENDAFTVPGEVVSATPEAAAAAIRQRYISIRAAMA
ncbi:hypothetical protein CF392_00245 [Tamilnaduibacter salinus]|uniref:Uncharacterized protein n=1 Tax=Tamilnaduibacter salinus TaxID=1484056 RepID=A0A2A2I8R7_9GAMM|nr:hypothetical protein [Tamilnaduibacter salinus]PAV27530.1 hypothetical protein CF392_00245 [Tamilnaduibacter salinus]